MSGNLLLDQVLDVPRVVLHSSDGSRMAGHSARLRVGHGDRFGFEAGPSDHAGEREMKPSAVEEACASGRVKGCSAYKLAFRSAAASRDATWLPFCLREPPLPTTHCIAVYLASCRPPVGLGRPRAVV